MKQTNIPRRRFPSIFCFLIAFSTAETTVFSKSWYSRSQKSFKVWKRWDQAWVAAFCVLSLATSLPAFSLTERHVCQRTYFWNNNNNNDIVFFLRWRRSDGWLRFCYAGLATLFPHRFLEQNDVASFPAFLGTMYLFVFIGKFERKKVGFYENWKEAPVFIHMCNATGPFNDETVQRLVKFPMVWVLDFCFMLFQDFRCEITFEKGQGQDLPGFADEKITTFSSKIQEWFWRQRGRCGTSTPTLTKWMNLAHDFLHELGAWSTDSFGQRYVSSLEKGSFQTARDTAAFSPVVQFRLIEISWLGVLSDARVDGRPWRV